MVLKFIRLMEKYLIWLTNILVILHLDVADGKLFNFVNKYSGYSSFVCCC